MIKKLIMRNKRNCLNCMFFCRTEFPQNSPKYHFSVKDNVRESIKKITKQTNKNNSYNCYKGIWNCSIDPTINKNFTTLLKKKRKFKECFFIQYKKGMMFQTAEELLIINREYKYQKITRRISVIGFGISILGIVVAYYK